MRSFCRRHGINTKGFSAEAIRALTAHFWPGNIRELQNVVERAIILCGENGILEPEHLGLGWPQKPAPTPSAAGFPDVVNRTQGKLPTLAEIEKSHILSALNHCNGNRTHAANMLNVSIRTLRNKLHEYNGTAPKQNAIGGQLVPL